MQWPLLEGLPPEDLQRVLRTARRRVFGRKEVIFHEGDHGDTLHLIDRGRVAVRVTTPMGDVSTLLILGPSDIFGELALLDAEAVRTATVIAIESTHTLSIVKAEFDRLRKNYPEVTEVLVRILADKVKRYTNQLLEALYVPADIRVLRRVLDLVDSFPDSQFPVIPLTQQDLAGLAGTSRATVNRVLREEHERGTLRLGRGRTVVLDRAALEKRAY